MEEPSMNRPEHRSAFERFNTPAVTMPSPSGAQPPNTPAVATAAADDDPVERLAREIGDLSQPDAKRLLRLIEERI
jgi:hypothetical protein